MAFADDLDELSPAGSDLLSLGDDAIRKLARAVSERLASAFQDPDVDPMLIKNGAIKKDQLYAGLQLRSILRATFNVNDTVNAGVVKAYAFAAPGAVTGDHVSFAYASLTVVTTQPMLIMSGYVSAADTIALYLFNPTGSNITLNEVISVAVIKTALIP